MIPDIALSPTTTSKGGAVVQIGQPRMQVTHPSSVEVRIAANRAFVAEADHVNIFELTHGTRVARIDPDRSACLASTFLTVSPDGQRIIVCRTLWEAPFATPVPKLRVSLPTFSTDSSRALFYNHDTLDITTLPDGAEEHRKMTSADKLGFFWRIADDGHRLISIATDGAQVAASGASQWTTLAKFPDPWQYIHIARSATAALGTTKTSLVHLDLQTGALHDLGAASPGVAISPNGQRVAVHVLTGPDPGFRIVDPTGALVATIPAELSAGNETFADDHVVAYVQHHSIALHDIARGPIYLDSPSRFRGWADDGTAIIERAGAWQHLDVATQTTTVASAPTPVFVANAPAWVTSWTRAASGTLMGTDHVSHDPVWSRAEITPCQRTVRAWAADTGEHAVSMTDAQCSVEVGEQWDIDGGRVARATESAIDVFNAATGRLVTTVKISRSKYRGAGLRHHVWLAKLSPDGRQLALWWRRADKLNFSGGTEEGSSGEPEADWFFATFFEFVRSEYFAELWSLEGKPARIWKMRLDAKDLQSWEEPRSRKATSQIVFTHDGKYVLLGFEDGDIMIRPTNAKGAQRIESLHGAPIQRIEVSPDDTYVYSVDTEGEQRIWPL